MESGRFAAALEITPPKRDLPQVLLRRASLLRDSVQAVNVIQRPGRQSSLDASIALREAGLNPAWHLVNRGRTRGELKAELARAHEAGIRQVLCIRGDHDAEDQADTPKLWELVGMAHELMPGAAIGATLNQYAPKLDGVFKNLGPKLRAGASYVQTQPVFDVEHLVPAAERLRAEFPGVRLVTMAMPLLSVDEAERIGKRLGFALPDSVVRRIASGAESAWEMFEENVSALAESRLVDGVAIMTFEMDPEPVVAERIIAALRRAGSCDASER
jgi:methylenetetrahydrofolate reductase (NADPH)